MFNEDCMKVNVANWGERSHTRWEMEGGSDAGCLQESESKCI